MTRSKAVFTAAMGVVILVGVSAIAQDAPKDGNREGRRGPGRRFGGAEMLKQMDTNDDKKVTFEEFKAFSEKQMQQRFDMMDRNGDGVLNEEDFPKGDQAQGAGGQRRRGDVQPPPPKGDGDDN